MIKIVNKLFIFTFIICGSKATAQFNTLTYFNPKKENQDNVELINQSQANAKKEYKNEKKNAKKIKFFTTKADLKKDIDSLKHLLIEYQSKNNKQKINIKKIEDSLVQIIKDKIGKNEIQKKYRTYQTYNLVEEPQAENNQFYRKLYMPLKGKLNVTSPFGGRIHPIFGGYKMHNGIDLGANYENVYSVLDGIITEAGWDSKGGGNYIKIKHSERFETSYLHLSQIYYKTGEYVKAGYIIGKSGNSGNSTAPHLHFSVKEYGKFINPIKFLNDLIRVNNLIAIYNG